MAKFSSDGKRVITLNYDYAAQVWDAATGNQLPRMNQGTDYHDRASFSPDGQRVVTATNSYGGANVKVFDAVTRKTTAEMNVPGGVNSMEFSPDGQRIVTANSDDTVSVWDATTGKQLAYLTGQTRRRTLFIMGGDPVPYLTASFSPNGRRVVTTSSEGLPAIYQIVSSDDVETIFGRLK